MDLLEARRRISVTMSRDTWVVNCSRSENFSVMLLGGAFPNTWSKEISFSLTFKANRTKMKKAAGHEAPTGSHYLFSESENPHSWCWSPINERKRGSLKGGWLLSFCLTLTRTACTMQAKPLRPIKRQITLHSTKAGQAFIYPVKPGLTAQGAQRVVNSDRNDGSRGWLPASAG